MKKHTQKSRRSFIKKVTGSALIAGAYPSIILPSSARSEPLVELSKIISPNDQVNIGIIGCGIMGFNNVRTAIKVPGVTLIAACDLYTGRLERMKEIHGKELFTTRNYKEIITRKDIDAVIVATDDHWHDRISIDAMKAGKAVYCEKPMVHQLDEGQAVIDTAASTKSVFQVGSQRVSSIVTTKAKELFERGEIGQLILADIRYDRQSSLGAWNYSIPPDASEKTVDWNSFIGDAPKRDYDPKRFFRWRNYRDYGTGVAGDLFVHLFSALHVITSAEGPNRIYATGGLRYWKDGRDVPDVMLGSYDYPETKSRPGFNVQMKVNFIDGSGGGSDIKLVGSEGVMTITGNSVHIKKSIMPKNPGYGGWDSYFTFSAATQKEFKSWYEAKYPDPAPIMSSPKDLEFTAPKGYDEHFDHFVNFFNGIRNGSVIVEDATFGLRAAGPALASNLSYFENKPIIWDANLMKVV